MALNSPLRCRCATGTSTNIKGAVNLKSLRNTGPNESLANLLVCFIEPDGINYITFGKSAHDLLATRFSLLASLNSRPPRQNNKDS